MGVLDFSSDCPRDIFDDWNLYISVQEVARLNNPQAIKPAIKYPKENVTVFP